MPEVDPLVSIIIPCYNHESYVQDCVYSVINQDYKHIELIIIDDGSKDKTADKIRELISECDNRFTRFEFRSRPNKGLCATLNEAIDWCEGEYFSAIASDDKMLPKKTTIQVAYLARNPQCDGVFGATNVINNFGDVVRRQRPKVGEVKFKQIFLQLRSVSTPTQMIRLSSVKDVGGYPPGAYIEDWYMWLRLLSNGSRLDVIGETLVEYRKHGGGLSANIERMHVARNEILSGYRSNECFKAAKAAANLSYAIDLQPYRKAESLRVALSSIKLFPAQLLTRRFRRYVVKIFVPYNILRR
ncbi:glycosyltransferase [Marinobacter fonticola]|uniref:glycosyltransferase n=1 Tax=Marinobacter fonticola TaxID=2603215 RepID=UPI0011E88FDB|nr:glycosyltransferase [Marinobacter fonticola]